MSLKLSLVISRVRIFLKVLTSLLKDLTNLSTTFESFRLWTTFFTFLINSEIYGDIFLNRPLKSRIESIQSLNFTIASPILAVTSRTLRSKAPNNFTRILKAILIGPPMTVVMISRAANKPLKVLEIASAFVSRVSRKPLVTLWNAAKTLNSRFAFSSSVIGNTSFQAFPIAVKVEIKPSPTFLNEFMNSHRPLIWSRLSINSSSGIPNFSAVDRSSWTAATCSSVNPADLISASFVAKIILNRFFCAVVKDEAASASFSDPFTTFS